MVSILPGSDRTVGESVTSPLDSTQEYKLFHDFGQRISWCTGSIVGDRLHWWRGGVLLQLREAWAITSSNEPVSLGRQSNEWVQIRRDEVILRLLWQSIENKRCQQLQTACITLWFNPEYFSLLDTPLSLPQQPLSQQGTRLKTAVADLQPRGHQSHPKKAFQNGEVEVGGAADCEVAATEVLDAGTARSISWPFINRFLPTGSS